MQIELTKDDLEYLDFALSWIEPCEAQYSHPVYNKIEINLKAIQSESECCKISGALSSAHISTVT